MKDKEESTTSNLRFKVYCHATMKTYF